MNNQGFAFRQLADAATDILVMMDKQGKICLANQNAQILEVATPQGDLGAQLPQGEFSDFYQTYQESMRRQAPQMSHLMVRDRLYQTSFYPHANHCAVCFHDITEKTDLSAELKQLSSRLNFAENIAQLGYWEFDWHHKRIYWSAQMYKIFGVNPQEVRYKRNIFKDYVYPDDLPQYWAQLQELIKHRHPVEGQLRIRRADNQVIYCVYKASVVQEGAQSKIAGTFQDVSKFILTQQALEKAKFMAEKANRDKSYFLAQASHDLRQPMQALNIFIAAMFDEGLSKKQQEILEKIEASAHNLNNLLNNLLDISKLDSGGIKYEPQEFNIGSLIRNIAKEYAELASCKHIKFHTLVHNGEVYSDPILIERIIRNLLSNAFKYTQSKIVLGCKREQDHIRIMILDNGPGISEQERNKIFEEFYQSPQIIDNRKQGAGLGLTIVSKIAAVIDTKIEISSIPGRGSCFSFLLPLLKF